MDMAIGAAATAAPPAPTRSSGATAIRSGSGAYARAVQQAEAEEHRHRIEAAYRHHYRTLVHICRERTADPSRAEDLAQETLVRALRYGHTLDLSRPILPWLRTIAARVVIDDAARAASQRETVIDLTGTDELVDDDFADSVVDHPALATAFARLSTLQQTALRLRFLEDWSGNDTARFLGVSRAACDQLVCRAKRRLRDELDRLGERHPALAPLTSGGLLARLRYAAAQRRAGITPWDATMTSLGVVVENVAVALVLTIASISLPGAAAAAELVPDAGEMYIPTAPRGTSSQRMMTDGIHLGSRNRTPPVASAPSFGATPDDSASARAYSFHPTADADLAQAPPTAVGAVLAEDDHEASVSAEASVSTLGHQPTVRQTIRIDCDGTSESLRQTCAAIDLVISASGEG